MQIVSVQLQNLRSYQDAMVEFVPGVNAIVGANGAGKSTILSAIGLALFNTRPPGIKGDDLVREGASSATVTVAFESAEDGRCYEVERRLGTNSRYRAYDPELGRAVVAEGVADIEGWLRRHLGVSAEMSLDDLFQNTIGVYQGTFTAPFLLSGTQRKAIFDPLLRVDEYRRAVEALREPVNALNAQDQVASERLAEIKGALSALDGLREQIAALEARMTQTGQALTGAQAALDGATARCTEYAALNEALRKAEHSRDQLMAAVGKVETSLGHAREQLWAARAARDRQQAAAIGYARYIEAEAKRKALLVEREQRDALRAQLATLDRDLAKQGAFEQAQRTLIAELTAVEARVAELDPLVRQQQELEEYLAEARERLARRQQALDTRAQLQRQLARQQDEVAALQAELVQSAQLDDERTQAQRALDRLQAQMDQAQVRLGQLLAERQQRQEQLDALAQAQGALCPVCEAPLTSEHRAELAERNMARLAVLDADLARLKQEQAQAEQERCALQNRVKQLGQRLLTLAGESHVQAAREQAAALQAELETCDRKLAQLGAPEQDVERLQRELALLGNPRVELATCLAELKKRAVYQAALDKAVAAQVELRAQRQQIEQKLAAYADLDERSAQVEATLASTRPDHEQYLASEREAATVAEREAQEASLAAELTALNEDLAQAEVAVREAAARYDPEQAASAQQERLRWQGEVSSLTTQLAADRDSFEQARQRQSELEARRAEEACLQAERGRIARATGLIEWARGLLRDAGPLVTRQLVRRISLDAANLYGELMDNHAARLGWSEDYALSLQVAAQSRGFAQLSGGEQMCAALALRLALLRNLSGIDVAFFDEPTAHLDAERRELLAHTLTEVQGFQQIFVISHDSTFEQAAQAYFVVTKDGDGSHIERR